MARDAAVMPEARTRDEPAVAFRGKDNPVLLTDSRTAEFLSWLQAADGPIADVMRQRAHFLAERWRRGNYVRSEKVRQTYAWLRNEIADAYLLRRSQETKSLVLRAAAMRLLHQCSGAELLDGREIMRVIQREY